MKKSIFEVVHESAKDLYEAGLVSAKTMHTFKKFKTPKNQKNKKTRALG